MHRLAPPVLVLLALWALASAEAAEKKYDPGASDSEIILGQTMPYSGPLSAFATLGRAELAYYRMVNEQGGVNARKIRMISLDDGYQPNRTVEQTRKLVEEEHVLAIVGSLGTPTNTAIQKYLNGKEVPQIFIATGATKWADPEHYPWTMTWTPTYQAEARIYARYILRNVAAPRIAILSQNDDFGRDYIAGLRDGLGLEAEKLIVAQATYEATDATVDSQVITLAASGANVFFNITTPKFASQSIRKAFDIGWHPTQFLDNPAASIGAVLRPAGLEKAKGVVSLAFVKDPTDPQFHAGADYRAWLAWMKQYYPEGSLEDPQNVVGYVQAQTVVQVLRQCGDELTRANVMRQAANLRHYHPDMLLEGIALDSSPTNYAPMQEARLERFDGERFVLLGETLSAK